MIEPRPAPTARLEACFTSASGQTILSHCLAAAPLKIAKTFRLNDGFVGCAAPIGVCLMDASPGLLAGDCYELSWQLKMSAHVFVSTQGFTRVHPSRERPCHLRQRIDIAEGALLEYFPEPLMLYRDAALHSETEIDIASGATLLLSEIVSSGRIGRGEAFQFAAFSNRLRVRCDGELIFISQTSLQPALQYPQRPGAWGDWTHSSNFYVFSSHANAALRDGLRAVLDEATAMQNTAEVWAGVSLLQRHGLAVSMLGRRACDLQSLSQLLREGARRHLCHAGQ